MPDSKLLVVLSTSIPVSLLLVCGCGAAFLYRKQKKRALAKREEAVDENPYYGAEMDEEVYTVTQVVDTNDYYYE